MTLDVTLINHAPFGVEACDTLLTSRLLHLEPERERFDVNIILGETSPSTLLLLFCLMILIACIWL